MAPEDEYHAWQYLMDRTLDDMRYDDQPTGESMEVRRNAIILIERQISCAVRTWMSAQSVIGEDG